MLNSFQPALKLWCQGKTVKLNAPANFFEELCKMAKWNERGTRHVG